MTAATSNAFLRSFAQKPAQPNKIQIDVDDLLYLVDRISDLRNEQQILLARITMLEKLFKWSMQMTSFFQSFSTLIFHNNLPVTAVIFNTDLLQLPFELYNYFDGVMKNLKGHIAKVYSHCSMLKKYNIQPPDFTKNTPPTWPERFDDTALGAWLGRLRTLYDKFVLDYTSDTAEPLRFTSVFDKLSLESKQTLVKDLEGILQKHNIPNFSASYLLQQTYISQILVSFASCIFKYVPQLKIDLSQHADFAIGAYLEQLEGFWSTQVNCVVEGYPLKYQSTNFPSPDLPADTLAKLSHYFAANSDDASFAKELQIYLWEKDARRFESPSYLRDPADYGVSCAWREVFLQVFQPKNPATYTSLFEQLTQTLQDLTVPLFNRRILGMQYKLFYKPSCLLNLRLTLLEQNILLRNIAQMLLMQFQIYRQDAAPPFSCFSNPLVTLAKYLDLKEPIQPA